MNKKHIGSNFDDFLKEKKIYEQAQAAAIKRVVAYQIAEDNEEKETDENRDGWPHEDQPGGVGTSARPGQRLDHFDYTGACRVRVGKETNGPVGMRC